MRGLVEKGKESFDGIQLELWTGGGKDVRENIGITVQGPGDTTTIPCSLDGRRRGMRIADMASSGDGGLVDGGRRQRSEVNRDPVDVDDDGANLQQDFYLEERVLGRRGEGKAREVRH